MTLNVVMSILSAALGACIGSFINVVIYRLPRGLSVAEPRRSFCPNCLTPIAGWDNIPILSYLLLRGRCRHCKTVISFQYPLVEALTALLFVATFDFFVFGHWRLGIGAWPRDGAIVAAHWLLWAGLLATAVMDIEAYYVDIRVTWILAFLGVLCHTLWTPAGDMGWIRPGPLLAAGCLAAAFGLLMTALFAFFLSESEEEEPSESPPAPAEQPDSSNLVASELADQSAMDQKPEQGTSLPASDTVAVDTTIVSEVEPSDVAFPSPAVAEPVPVKSPSSLGGIAAALIGFAVIIGYLLWMFHGSANDLRQLELMGTGVVVPSMAGLWRLVVVVVLLMAATIAVSSVPREADEEILDAIEEESGSARGLALRETAWLLPAALAGLVAMLLVQRGITPFAGWIEKGLTWSPYGQWRPVLGLATGLSGFLLAGALGWAVRILFTILLGKEALGVGDIHILAAAGAVTGWPAVVLGFFLAAPLALVGVLIFALRRKTRAIQYGPWLAIGIFLAAMCQDVILDVLRVGWILR